jgi:ribosomal protein L11 methyltransferase
MVTQLSPGVYLYTGDKRPHEIPADRLALRQLPSGVFGDGSHPTTRICAGAVDLLCRQKPRSAMLDVGTGTGVLARIARARGSEFTIATDIDPQALLSAREHVALDSSVYKVLVSDSPPDAWGPRFDLVVANILEGPLRSLAPSLAHAVAPGGTLLISGFTPLQTPALQTTFTAAGLVYTSESALIGWALLMFTKTA